VTAHALATSTRFQGGNLTSVSCPTATRCFASGIGSVKNAEVGLIVPIVNGVPTGYVAVHATSADGLTAIACPTSTTCYALGLTARVDKVFTFHNGKVTASKPVPSGGRLNDIVCQGAHLCDASGSAVKGSGNTHGAVLPIRNGVLGKLQLTSVTTLYAGGDTDSIETMTGFKGGIAMIGFDNNQVVTRNVKKTILSIS
jgi:hypothetical protein